MAENNHFGSLKPKKIKYDFVGVTGTNVIKHRDRRKLGLKCVEYVCMQYVDQWCDKDDKFKIKTEEHIWKHIGLELSPFIQVLGDLCKKRILSTEGEHFVIGKDWRHLHPKEELLFQEIWTLLREKGNKATARRNFNKCCQKQDPALILQRAKLYSDFHTAKGTELTYWLKAENFLDPQTEKYLDKIGNEHATPTGPASTRGKLG